MNAYYGHGTRAASHEVLAESRAEFEERRLQRGLRTVPAAGHYAEPTESSIFTAEAAAMDPTERNGSTTVAVSRASRLSCFLFGF